MREYRNLLLFLRLILLVGFCIAVLSCDKDSASSNNDDPIVTIIVRNGGFETQTLEGWTVTGDTLATISISDSSARSGSYCAMIDGAGGLEQKVTGLIPATQYSFTGYLKCGTSDRGKIGIKAFGGRDISRRVRDTEYYEYKYDFMTGDTSTSAVIYFANDRTTGTVYGDDFSLEREAVPPSDGVVAYAPEGYKWVRNDAFSDEFNGTELDASKWWDYNPRWEGRPPAKFKPFTVSVKDGYLQIQNAPLEPAEDQFNIAGGAVQSKAQNAHFGYYECRMKASKISMSSTFWLTSGWSTDDCPRFAIEIDIQEAIGAPIRNPGWEKKMHSNTHFNYVPCSGWDDRENKSVGGNTDLGGGAGDAFYNYGCWWVDANTIKFYVNGEYRFTINPSDYYEPEPFNIPCFMNLVTETYDWEMPPTRAQLLNNNINTTYYDWVRSWKLVKK